MKIEVNGTRRDTTATHVAALLDELGFGDQKVATAVNGEFLPASMRTETKLTDGDRIEILTPMQGG